MSRRYDTSQLFITQQKIAMSSRIVADKDAEYSWYAGASFQIASQMAIIDTLLKLELIPKDLVAYVKIYRAYLDQMRKAYFATDGSSELTKLGFIQGEPKIVKRATAPATY